MKSFRKQIIECNNAGFRNETVFESFADHPELMPAFPWKKSLQPLMRAIESGELKGLDKTLCGRFGGDCNSGNPDCRRIRELSD